jgi:hypothetical protein
MNLQGLLHPLGKVASSILLHVAIYGALAGVAHVDHYRQRIWHQFLD